MVLRDPPDHNSSRVQSFAPYILFEVPGNLLLKHFRPRVWSELNSLLASLQPCGVLTCLSPVPISMFIFGCITIAQGLVKNYSGLLAARFFLGVAEAGIFPGCIYLISMYAFYTPRERYNGTELAIRWYKREEAQKRFTAFLASTSLAGAFGGLFAYAISKLDGAAGLASWRWVFVVGGSLRTPPVVAH